MGKYDALFDAPAAPAPDSAAGPSVAAQPSGKYAALFDAPAASAPIDEPAGIGLSGPGSKDTSPTTLAPTSPQIASESKVPGHQAENQDSSVPEVVSVLNGAKEGFRGMGREALSANRQLSNVILHPVDTLGDERFRNETMRGVNKMVMPVVGNKLVAAIGGPPEESASDRAAFPDAQALGGIAGMAVPVPYGEIAAAVAKPAKAAVGGLLGAVERAGAGAEERQVGRAVEDITEGASKRARAGLRESEDTVEMVARENPEIVAHSRNNDALADDAEKIAQRGSENLKTEYQARDMEQRKPVATDIISRAEQEEERAAAAKAEASANPAGSDARAKAEQEAIDATERARGLRREAARKISDSRTHGMDPSDAVANMDRSIAYRRRDGATTEDHAVADALESIRDKFTATHRPSGIVPAEAMRAQQSVYQRAGYAKVMPGMKDADIAQAQILANRQASKDVGDAIYSHMGYDGYQGAVKAAEADPNSLAARLLKLNGEVEGANRILAAVASKKAASHGGKANFLNLIFHSKHTGRLGAAALVAGEMGLHRVAGALGTAAGAVAAAPIAARYADNALAAAGRGAEALSAKITPQAVSEVIDLAAAPTTSYADVVASATKRGIPVRVAAQIAASAGKSPGPAAVAPPGMPLMAQQEAQP